MPPTFCNNHVQWPCKKTLHTSVYHQLNYTTYLDFPNQFPMTATKQGQQVDWNNPENKQVQEIAIHLQHKCGIYCKAHKLRPMNWTSTSILNWAPPIQYSLESLLEG